MIDLGESLGSRSNFTMLVPSFCIRINLYSTLSERLIDKTLVVLNVHSRMSHELDNMFYRWLREDF